ncbi:MAG TPA: class I SAM-dependent methyltransferase [Steroidobacteraceae bacterium]|nr:class I SAM-dependent methyltransferase [Steroidobacteraceae bacterium]
MQVRNLKHALLPTLTPDERSRQRFVVALRRALNTHVRPRNVELYDREGLPAFEARNERPPQTTAEIAEAFAHSPGYRLWSAMNRSAQELVWMAAGEPVLRDAERIDTEAEKLIADQDKLGQLHLDTGFNPPREIADVDIHLQPGGYALERHARDVTAGALYENGGNVYSFGQGIGKTDSKAGAVIAYLSRTNPDFAPRKILEIGCSAGAAACAYAAHYLEADVHAIDIGAGMLRYAHARAESLHVRVIFHQMSGTDLKFADGTFDLVVSNNLLHEIGRENRQAMLREARRVLAPGGITLHQDVPIRAAPTVVHQVERGWDERYNGEIFWNTYAGDDLLADMQRAGFAIEDVTETCVEKLAGAGDWYFLIGEKSA